MSGDVNNSQAVRDAERASADLLQALNNGASSSDVAELMSVKVKADERVVALRRRIEPPALPPRRYRPRQSTVDQFGAREHSRESVRAEMKAERPT
jgi:hypothetical protein